MKVLSHSLKDCRANIWDVLARVPYRNKRFLPLEVYLRFVIFRILLMSHLKRLRLLSWSQFKIHQALYAGLHFDCHERIIRKICLCLPAASLGFARVSKLWLLFDDHHNTQDFKYRSWLFSTEIFPSTRYSDRSNKKNYFWGVSSPFSRIGDVKIRFSKDIRHTLSWL